MPRKDRNSSKQESRADLPQRNLKRLKYEFHLDLMRNHADAHAPTVAVDLQRVTMDTLEMKPQEFVFAYGFWSMARDGYSGLLRFVRASLMQDDETAPPIPGLEPMTEFRGVPAYFLVQIEPGLFGSMRKQDASVDQAENGWCIFNHCLGKSTRISQRWKAELDRGRQLEGRFGKGLPLAELNRLAEAERALNDAAASGEKE